MIQWRAHLKISPVLKRYLRKKPERKISDPLSLPILNELSADFYSACSSFRKQGGHRTHFNTCLTGVAGNLPGLRVTIKGDDRVDSAPGKGQSGPVVLLAADIDAFSA